MAYTPQTWHDAPATDTPISSARLGYIEQGIVDVEANGVMTVIVVTGEEARPSTTNTVFWKGGDPDGEDWTAAGDEPENIGINDIWLRAVSAVPSGIAPVITTTSLGTLTQGVPFSLTLVASGTEPKTWTAASGSGPLPSGLTRTGASITGTPNTGSETGSFTMEVSNGILPNDTQAYPFTVAPSGGGGSVGFHLALSTGVADAASRSLTLTGVTAGDDVLIGIATENSATISSLTYSLGDTITVIPSGSVGMNNAPGFGSLYTFKISNISAGGGNVNLTLSGTSNHTLTALAYTNVGTITAVATSYGYATSQPLTATNVTNGIVVGFFGAYNGTYTATDGNQRTLGGGDLAVGDKTASGAQTITATCSNATWGGVIMVLNPAA